MRQQAIVLSFLALTSVGCGQPVASVSLSSVRALETTVKAPANKAEFVKAVAALGVKLTEQQLATISANRAAKPCGAWAPRPAVNLTAEQNLDVHFKKHGGEFTPRLANAQAYMSQAMDLANGKRGAIEYYFDSTSFQKGYQSNVVIWNKSTRELTAMRPDGAMTTYYHDNNLASNRFVIVPSF